MDIGLLVLGAVIWAALLAWAADCPVVTPPPITTLDPVAAVTVPEPIAPPVVPDGAGVTAGERNGKPMLTVHFDTLDETTDTSRDNTAARRVEVVVKP